MEKEIWGFLVTFLPVAAFGLSPGPILLERTALAPLGATGSALFITGGEADRSLLTIQVNGLSPGHYVVEGVSNLDEQLIILAPLVLVDPTDAPDREVNNDFKQPSNAHQAAELLVQTQLALPPGIRPGDLKRIIIAQASGSQVMVGKVGG